MDLKAIYRAATGEQAERQLAAFEAKWNRKYPSIGALWRRNWQGIVPFFQFSPEIRKIVKSSIRGMATIRDKMGHSLLTCRIRRF